MFKYVFLHFKLAISGTNNFGSGKSFQFQSHNTDLNPIPHGRIYNLFVSAYVPRGYINEAYIYDELLSSFCVYFFVCCCYFR